MHLLHFLPMALLNNKLLLLLLLLLPALHAFSIVHPSPTQESAASTFESSLINQACFNTANSSACTSRLRIECQHNPHTPLTPLHAAVRSTIAESIRAIDTISSFATLSGSFREQTAIQDCTELLDRTVDELSWSLSEISRIEFSGGHDIHLESNLRSWLSAALSNQDTCLEGFEGTDGRLRRYVGRSLAEVTQLVGNILAMYRRMRSIIPHRNNGTGSELPPWIAAAEEDIENMNVDAVVALDGSGRFRTVAEAVEAAPSHGRRRYVIFVKKGVYKENVELKKKKSNIMIVGEGMGVTVIAGGRNFMQGWTTFRTATFGKCLNCTFDFSAH